MKLAYSLDTSALIGAWDRHYPRDIFPEFWSGLSQIVAERRAACIDEVREELSKKDDELFAWSKGQDGLFVELEEQIQTATSKILAHPEWRKLTDSIAGRSVADPMVIALAQVRGAAVVTYEVSAPKRIKIPDVCRGLNVPCISVLEMMRRERWRFSRSTG